MGSVWRADDLALNAPVAIKLIDPSIAQSPEAVARFQREAQAAAAIRSTYVVQILEHGVEGNVPFIAMELLDGESLAARLERDGRLTPAQTARILSQVGQALTRAHASKIVHRDLKPDNIFLVSEGNELIAKVLDFGIARRLGELSQSGGLQTQVGTTLGTPNYMSPEQAGAKPVDDRSDIWSFGVIAFECLTGHRPFEAETWGGLFQAICLDPLPIPSQVGPVPAGFDAWFARAAARNPNDRFPSASEAAMELRRVCGVLGTDPEQVSPPPASLGTLREPLPLDRTASPASVTAPGIKRIRSRRLAIAAIAGLLVIAATLAAWRWRRVSSLAPSAAASAGRMTGTSGVAQAQPSSRSAESLIDAAAVPIELANRELSKSTGQAIQNSDVTSSRPTDDSKPASRAASSVRDHKASPAPSGKGKYRERVGF
jgi:eukaryotic-like serine/threonine-protein kinase